jgi:hypothetical protein
MARRRFLLGALVLAAAGLTTSPSAADWDDLVISVTPASPTDEETFDLRALKPFHDSGFVSIDQSIAVHGNQIDVRALVQDQHTRPGHVFLTVISPRGAFFNDYGPLAAGTYTVNAEIWYTAWPSTTYDFLYDEGSLQFTVTGVGTQQQLAGDYDGNDVVDVADYIVWRKTLNGASPAADGNGNGQVDPDDYTVWRSHFGMVAGGGSTRSQVPEPTAIILAAAAACTCVFRRHGRRG